MKKRAYCVLTALVLALWMFAPAVADPGHRRHNTPVYYLSLGTSLAAGIQPDPLTGENIITDSGYPDQLAALLGDDIRKLRHVNLGCPAEAAETFINGGICDYRHGSQLDEALHFLHAHGKFTGLITIDLGANDVLQCLDGTAYDPKCLQERLAQLASDLSYILQSLREAAPHAPIVGMNYYNPLLAYYKIDPAFAQLTAALQAQINAVITSVYTQFGIPVADVAGAFMTSDLITDADGNGWPDSVDLVCAWTWMCSPFQNIHANDEGYAVIADEFYAVLPQIPVSTPPRRRHASFGNP